MKLEIHLPLGTYRELAAAAAVCSKADEVPVSVEEFAREAIECVLASRRQLTRRGGRRRPVHMATNPERAVRVGHAGELEELTA